MYEKKADKIKIGLGFFAGGDYGYLKVLNDNNKIKQSTFLQNSSFTTGISPNFGVYVNLNSSRVNQRLFLQYEANFTQRNYMTNNYYVEAAGGMSHSNDISFKQTVFGNLISLKYQAPSGLFRPFFHCGFFLNVSSFNDYQRKEVVNFSTGVQYYSHNYVDDIFSGTEFGLSLGAGVATKIMNKRDLFLDIKYQLGDGFSDGFTSNNFYFNLGLQIW